MLFSRRMIFLMHGAVEDNGKLRDHPCHAGTHVYPKGDSAALRASLIQIIEQYNTSMRQVSPALVEPATLLFYDTVTLHPFQNGNGRLCRLLVAFAMILNLTTQRVKHLRAPSSQPMLAILTGKLLEVISSNF